MTFFLLLSDHFPKVFGGRGTDTALLIRQCKDPDARVRLDALTKVFKEVYKLSPLKASPYAREALNLARKTGNRAAEADALYYLSFYYSTTGKQDSAFYWCQVGMDISKALNSKPLIARGHLRLGSIYRVSGEKAKAIDQLTRALALDSTNREFCANAWMSLSLVYGDIGDCEKAVYFGLKSLKIREEQNELVEAGYLSCNLAGNYFQPSYREEGFKSLEHAVALFRQAKFPKGEAYAYNHLGSAWYDRKDYVKALNFFRKSMALNAADTITIRSAYAFNLTNIGDALLKLKYPDSARIYYRKALAFSSRDNEAIPMACAYISMGKLEKELKNYDLAIEYINKGLFHSRIANYREQWEDAYNALSECYSARGNHEMALFYLKKRNAVRDSIITLKAQQEVANMMIRYETEKKDRQITQLNIDSRKKQEKIRLAIIGIVLILFASGTMTILTLRYYRRNLKPKVRTLNFIQEQINREKDGDNRRLRALEKVLPPELKPFGPEVPPEPAIDHALAEQLENLMSREKIYLNENLTLSETAGLLSTNTTYLSRLINEHYKMNFSAYLNRYRVEEAKRMILDQHFSSFSMEGISKSSGFRSKSTFNQAFKNLTGMTPTEFLNRNGHA